MVSKRGTTWRAEWGADSILKTGTLRSSCRRCGCSCSRLWRSTVGYPGQKKSNQWQLGDSLQGCRETKVHRCAHSKILGLEVCSPVGFCKGAFHAKMGSIRDRNCRDLTEAEDIKKSGQKYTEELYKKIFMTQIITMVWSLTWSQTSWNVKSSRPYKASLQTKLVEVMEFQLSYFKSWKMMLWKCWTQYDSKFGKLNNGHRTGKGPFSFQSQREAMPKNAQTTAQFYSSHTLVK